MLDHKIELLQQVPLFRGLSEELLEAIAAIGQKTFFEADAKLITEGETGSTAYLIMTGKAACPRIEGGELYVEDLWPGTLVGELGMLVETVHSVSVTAQERLRALAFSRDAFRATMEKHPELAQHISEKLLVRLHGLAAEIRRVDGKLAEIEKSEKAA
ncbi:cyclic nucleotide-binding domain-containing protein [Rhodomicrobium vannielii ATCC 17100]|uniref:cyclic nucleotide-binding domain-containing protein n=1 Tax=Rhodomicrobium vannielii TaxID=1069 RepID=UPI001917C82F|nr:cyclic nucleotide-binding domain-containing protein [Rhodomicrobium vannielii]MBJ7535149.1 cyclic nucleotide-binding domain-containing protein [Rhodomicrobium vannielii ATCC 17100]